MSANQQSVLLALFGAALLAGCATPRPVLDLASQGMVVAGQAEAELQAFVAVSNRTYERRLALVRGLARDDIDADMKSDFETYTAERAGMRAEIDRAKMIRDLADFRAKLRDKAIADQAELEKKVMNSGDGPQVPKEKLAELRNALAQLSEELSTEEWLKFSLGYGKQVYQGYKEAKAKAAAADAKIAK
jgi:hypothetical protein